LRFLGNGRDFGLIDLNYAQQQGVGGIAGLLGLDQDLTQCDPTSVILGAKIVERNIRAAAENFKKQRQEAGILSSRQITAT
jgi:glucose-1-phosphate thymidylyltransferase